MAGYGNDIKDRVNAGGPRIATAGNPLGIAGVGSQATGNLSGKSAQATKSVQGKGNAGNPLGL